MRAAGHDLGQLKEAHGAAAKVAAGAAAQRAPVRSGRLKNTIRASGTNTAGVVRAGFKSVPYAGPIHWGWPSKGITANPFMSEGAQASENQWVPIYEAAVTKAIAQVKGK